MLILIMVPIATILFAIIAKFVHVRELEQQLVSNKASEFCCRFTHIRKDILLTENANTAYTDGIGKDSLDSKQKISKSIDIKGAITLSITVISFLVTLQFLEKVGSNNLTQIIIFSITSVVSLFLFITVEKKAQFPLIDFKLLKNKIILSANIINMTVGLTALMVVYQSLPILIRSPPPTGFGGDASSIAIVQLPYMVVSLIFSVASGFVVAKFGNLRPTTMGTIVTTLGFFILFIYHSSEASYSCRFCHCSCWISFNANRFCECCSDFNPKAIQRNIVGMNLLIYLIGSSVGPVIAGIYMQANQIFVEIRTGVF